MKRKYIMPGKSTLRFKVKEGKAVISADTTTSAGYKCMSKPVYGPLVAYNEKHAMKDNAAVKTNGCFATFP